jgi:sugar phosphate isomerase/epimerase
MSILISDWGLLERALPLAQNFGVGIEVAEFTIPENVQAAPALAPAIVDQLAELRPVGMHAPFAELVPASKDPLVRQVARTRLQQGYEAALAIHASHLVVHSGFFPKTYPRAMWIDNSFDFWSEFLEDKPVPGFIHMENVYEDDFTPLQELIDRVNLRFSDERLTACLDIGHVNANSTRNMEGWIKALGDRIRYVHLHNNDGLLDDHWRLDRGKINVTETLDLLRAYAPQAVWTVETLPLDTEPTLLWLREKGYL